MDGKGRCMDNIFIERLWRSLKYEEVYLHAYGSVAEAKCLNLNRNGCIISQIHCVRVKPIS